MSYFYVLNIIQYYYGKGAWCQKIVWNVPQKLRNLDL